MLLTVLTDQLDLCRVISVIDNNADFVTFFSNYALSFAISMLIYELGNIICGYKRNYSLKISKEKFGVLKIA